jgi:uncharacterized protein with von Willebrand factor type A (vWA) domain
MEPMSTHAHAMGPLEVVRVDGFDRDMLRSVAADVPGLQDLRSRASDTVMHAPELVQDLNAVFWKAEPALRPAGELHPGAVLNRTAVEAILSHPDTEELRRHTVYDRYATALATMSVGDRVIEVLADYEDRRREIQEQIDARAAAGGDDPGGDGDEPDGPGDPGGEQPVPDDLRQALDDLAGQASARMSGAVHAEITQQLADRTDERASAAAWGIEPGELQKMDYQARKDLAGRLSGSRMARFRELIGRFRMTARSEQARKAEFGRDELYSITLGRDLSEVLPSELVLLAHPRLREQFIRRFAEGQLLSRKWRGRQRAGDGPIIVLIDTSGSMEGDPEGWSKAFALSLMEVARQDGRAFTTILFSSRTQSHRVDGTGLDAMIEVGETFLGGGTSYDRPLAEAIGIATADDAFAKSDIVMVTDGECDMSEATWQRLAAAREAGLRVFGIAVGMEPGAVLARMCDNVRSITDFTDANAVSDIYTVL